MLIKVFNKSGNTVKTNRIIKYNLKNDSDLISIGNFSGDSLKDFMAYVSELEKDQRCKNVNFHGIISFPKDVFVSDEIANEIVKKYLNELGYGKQPFLVFRHNDTDHLHFHIVTTRIDVTNSTKINDSNEFRRSEKIKNKLIKEYGLDYPLDNKKGVANELSELVDVVMKETKPTNLDELRAGLIGLNVSFHESKKGITFFFTNKNSRGVSSSDLNVFKEKSLKKQISANLAEKRSVVRVSILEFLEYKKSGGTADLQEYLGFNIRVTELKNKDNLVGFNFVYRGQKFKGSEVGLSLAKYKELINIKSNLETEIDVEALESENVDRYINSLINGNGYKKDVEIEEKPTTDKELLVSSLSVILDDVMQVQQPTNLIMLEQMLLAHNVGMQVSDKGIVFFFNENKNNKIGTSKLDIFKNVSLRKQISLNRAEKRKELRVLINLFVKERYLGNKVDLQQFLGNNVNLIQHTNKSGGVYGISFELDGETFKGSEVGLSLAKLIKLDGLGQQQQQNVIIDKEDLDIVLNIIMVDVMIQQPTNLGMLEQMLSAHNVGMQVSDKGIVFFFNDNKNNRIGTSKLDIFKDVSLRKQISLNRAEKRKELRVLINLFVKERYLGNKVDLQQFLGNNVNLIQHTNKSGGVYGISFELDGETFKGSEVGLSLAKLIKLDGLGQQQQQKFNSVDDYINSIINSVHSIGNSGGYGNHFMEDDDEEEEQRKRRDHTLDVFRR